MSSLNALWSGIPFLANSSYGSVYIMNKISDQIFEGYAVTDHVLGHQVASPKIILNGSSEIWTLTA